MPGSGKLSLTWVFQILWVVTGRQCCLRYMVQYPSVHLGAEALGNKQGRENLICPQLHCAGTVHGSAGSWMGTMDREEQRDRVKKDCGCSGVPQRQRSCFGRAEAAGSWTAQPGLQGRGSRREHPQAMQPFAALFPTFVFFSSSSQNSYLLEQASCQDVAIEMFALDPGCDLCSTTMLGKSTPPQQVAENIILAVLKITNFDSLPLQKLFSMPHYAILQSPGTKTEIICIESLKSKHLGALFPAQILQLWSCWSGETLRWPRNVLLLSPTILLVCICVCVCVCVYACHPDLSMLFISQ